MNRRRLILPAVGAICLGLLVMVLFLSGNDASKATENNEAQIFVAGSGCNKVAVVKSAMANLGFAPDSYVIGAKNINFEASEANERSADSAFSSETPKSTEEVVAELSSGSERANAALDHVIKQSGADRDTVLNRNNWLGVQFNENFLLPGNTGFRNGAVFDAGTRNSSSGDVVWFFVSPTKCRQVANGQAKPEDALTAHRGACGNPQSELPRPINPRPTPPTNPTNPTTPTTQPPCGNLCKGPDIDPAPCVDNEGVRCDGIPGAGGQPGNGGAVDHGDDGYSEEDPPPPTVVTTVPPPTTVVTLPPTTVPPPPTTIVIPG